MRLNVKPPRQKSGRGEKRSEKRSAPDCASRMHRATMPPEPPERVKTHLVNCYGAALYNRLYDTGANLNFIWVLHVWLLIADAVNEILHKASGQSARMRRLRERKRAEAERRNHFATAAKSCFQAYITGLLQVAKESDPNEPLLNPSHPEFFSRFQEVSLKIMPRIIDSLENELINTARRFAEGENKEPGEENAFAEVLREYGPLPGRYATGGNGDLPGSFFLLALTEHLNTKSGRYDLAHKLLNAIRGGSAKPRQLHTPPAQLVRKRVSRLKRDHSAWRRHLDILTRQSLSR